MRNLHGIISLILIKSAVLVALVYLFFASIAAGILYLMLVVFASAAIVFAYCAKCEAREHHCSHIVPGYVTRWLPTRRPGPYTLIDIAATGAALSILFLFPQYWLWQNKTVFFFFWALTSIALAEILLRVCPSCRNRNCLLCRLERLSK